MKEAERDIREALQSVIVPEQNEAAERSWEVVRSAHAECPDPRPPHRMRRRGLQLALAVGVAAVLVSPAGASVRHWVADAVSPGVKHAKPALTSLPTPGSLLIQSGNGPWVVHADGSKRLLGNFSGASWSPHGLYVAATSQHELAAVDQSGKVRWALDRTGPVRLASWNGPDGFRVTYLNGDSLRVVDGDGTGDRLLEPQIAPVAPAWKPGFRYVLAFAESNGTVTAVQTETGKAVFRTAPGPRPVSLQWSTDGRNLLVTDARKVELLDKEGKRLWRWSMPPRTRIVAARLAPGGDQRIALILRGGTGNRILLGSPTTPPRTLFSGPGLFSELEWSPNGDWLLLPWKSADQWLFLNLKRPGKIDAISNVSQQFAPGAQPGAASFPRIDGWCCSR